MAYGCLEGYLEGEGLGKVTLLTSYLFVMAMEVLSRMLLKMAMSGNFNYHSKCKKHGYEWQLLSIYIQRERDREMRGGGCIQTN